MMRIGRARPGGRFALLSSAIQNWRMNVPPGVPGRVVAMSISGARAGAAPRTSLLESNKVMVQPSSLDAGVGCLASSLLVRNGLQKITGENVGQRARARAAPRPLLCLA